MTLEVRGAGTPAGAASGTHDDQRARMLTGDGRMKAILVADDDAGTRDLLRGALATVNGWVATAVVDGAAVLRLLESEQPDLVVLDVTLPGLDGVAVYHLLRACAHHPSVPVLFLSGEVRPRELRTHAARCAAGRLPPRRESASARRAQWAHEVEGCFRWLAKPFRLDDLLAVAADLLEGEPQWAAVGDGGCGARPRRATCCDRNREPP